MHSVQTASRLSIAATVLGALFAAAPAHAYTLIGANHVPNPALAQAISLTAPTLLFNVSTPPGVRLAAPAAGVITRWRMHSGDVAAGGTIRLRVLEPVGGSDYKVVRSGPLHTMPLLTGQANKVEFDESVPIAAGQIVGAQLDRAVGQPNEITIVHVTVAPAGWKTGYLAATPPADGETGTADIGDGTMAGASDPFFPISADVEADADGDGFGDETRDRCPGSGGPQVGCPSDTADPAPLPPGRGITMIGPNMEPDPATSEVINQSNNSLVFNDTAMAGVELLGQERGVITRWQVYVGDVTAGATVQLRVLQRVGDARYLGIASGAVQTLGASSGQANLRTFAARIPINLGQQVGVAMTKPAAGALELTLPAEQPAPSPWSVGLFVAPGVPAPADGGLGYASISLGGGAGVEPFYALSATVERDSDGDLFGDHTQDRCPDEAGTDNGCPVPGADPTPTPTPQVQVQTVYVREPPVVTVNTVVPETALAQLDAGSVKVSADRRKLTATVMCPTQKTASCPGTLSGAVKVGKTTRSMGATRFSVRSGRARSVTVKVPSRTRKIIAKRKRLSLTVTLTGAKTLKKTVG